MLTKADAPGGPPSVLLVEGDAAVARLVISALEAEGYRNIGTAASVWEAKKIAHWERPDMVLLNGEEMSFDEFDSRVARQGKNRHKRSCN